MHTEKQEIAMIVQLSSGQGPSECELAVLKLYEALKKEYIRLKSMVDEGLEFMV